MVGKDIVKKVYNELSIDSPLLIDMELSDFTPELISNRIAKTRQVLSNSGNETRLAIWLGSTKLIDSRRVEQELCIDIHLPLSLQIARGLAFTLGEDIKRVLTAKGFRLGTGIHELVIEYDLETKENMYLARVTVKFNMIKGGITYG